MYIPKSLKMQDTAEMHAFMQAFSFATVVSKELEATSMPLLLDQDEGEMGVLYGHFARANKQWRNADGAETLVLFNGPHAYISPRWYAIKPAVPTWNYAAVHAYGRVTLLNDEQTADVVERITAFYEPDLMKDRAVVTPEVQAKLLPAIVGFKIVLTNIEGKLKLGQHKHVDDQIGVTAGLQEQADTESTELLAYMQQKQLGLGGE